jgi:hypothetical protein
MVRPLGWGMPLFGGTKALHWEKDRVFWVVACVAHFSKFSFLNAKFNFMRLCHLSLCVLFVVLAASISVFDCFVRSSSCFVCEASCLVRAARSSAVSVAMFLKHFSHLCIQLENVHLYLYRDLCVLCVFVAVLCFRFPGCFHYFLRWARLGLLW